MHDMCARFVFRAPRTSAPCRRTPVCGLSSEMASSLRC